MERSFDKMTSAQLIADFKVVLADAEALLAETANQGGEKMAKVRAKAEVSRRRMKDRGSMRKRR
jgi:ElaB/YqjD/DUF883 family membrane-anchored ribosome-binding protein